jgi:hypothetical protein
MAQAGVELAPGRRAEGRGRAARAHEPGEAVDVRPEHLDLGHAGPGLLGQPALDDLARRDPGRGIHGQHAHAVERHGAPEDPGRLEREVPHAAATVGEAIEIVSDAFRRHPLLEEDLGAAHDGCRSPIGGPSRVTSRSSPMARAGGSAPSVRAARRALRLRARRAGRHDALDDADASGALLAVDEDLGVRHGAEPWRTSASPSIPGSRDGARRRSPPRRRA